MSAGIGSVVSSKALLHGWCRIAIAIVLYVYTITASQACSTSFKRPSMNTENHISDKLHHSCTSNFSDTTALIETLYVFLITHTPTYKSQTITLCTYTLSQSSLYKLIHNVTRTHLPNLPCRCSSNLSNHDTATILLLRPSSLWSVVLTAHAKSLLNFIPEPP